MLCAKENEQECVSMHESAYGGGASVFAYGSVCVCEGVTYEVSAMANVGRVMRLSELLLLKKACFGSDMRESSGSVV